MHLVWPSSRDDAKRWGNCWYLSRWIFFAFLLLPLDHIEYCPKSRTLHVFFLMLDAPQYIPSRIQTYSLTGWEQRRSSEWIGVIQQHAYHLLVVSGPDFNEKKRSLCPRRRNLPSRMIDLGQCTISASPYLNGYLCTAERKDAAAIPHVFWWTDGSFI